MTRASCFCACNEMEKLQERQPNASSARESGCGKENSRNQPAIYTVPVNPPELLLLAASHDASELSFSVARAHIPGNLALTPSPLLAGGAKPLEVQQRFSIDSATLQRYLRPLSRSLSLHSAGHRPPSTSPTQTARARLSISPAWWCWCWCWCQRAGVPCHLSSLPMGKVSSVARV